MEIMAMPGNENSGGGPVHVRTGRVRQGRTRFRQRERANDHQRETSWSTSARVRTGTPGSMRMTQSRKVSERERGCARLLEQLRNS